MTVPLNAPVRLTSLAHGGGCGCKLAPSVLRQLLSELPPSPSFERLLVGTDTGDDAAVFALDGGTCVISTTDFFMPIVDDPHDFGRIAATNALSDVYAMGGKPIMAVAVLGMPLGRISTGTVREILKGGAFACAQAGIPVAGGHSIDCAELVYGLAVTGICRREDIRRNADARPGDALILTKPLGVGIYSAAFRKEALPAGAYSDMLASMTLLNSIGAELARDADVHAMTDVTGFGLIGHALEMARAANLSLTLHAGELPLLPETERLSRRGFVTGASQRNLASCGADAVLPDVLPDWLRSVLFDPQTSGGLLVACAPGRAQAVRSAIAAAGCPHARIIGYVNEGAPPAVTVRL